MGKIFCWLFFVLFVSFIQKEIVFSQEEKKYDLELSRAYNESGDRLFSEGKYLLAAGEFLKAWEAYPKVEAIFNAALSYEKGEDFEKAIFWYKEYLKAALPEEQEKVSEKIAELEKKIVKVKEDKVVEEKIDEETVVKKEIQVAEETKEIEDFSSLYGFWKWASTAATLSFLGFALTFYTLAVNQAEEAEKYYPDNFQKYRSEYRNAATKQKISYVFYGLTGVAAVASGILWYLDLTFESEQGKKLAILPSFDSDFAGGQVIFSF